MAVSLPDTTPVEETLTDMWNRDRDDSGGVVEHEVAGSEGAAAGTNGHGLVVELVLGEGDLWPSNVGNELLGKPAQGGIRTGLRGCASLLHGIYATKNNHSNNQAL